MFVEFFSISLFFFERIYIFAYSVTRGGKLSSYVYTLF